MALFRNEIYRERETAVPYAKTVKITENKAPTDDSIRLFEEFQEKANNNLLDTLKIETNTIKAGVMLFRYPMGFEMYEKVRMMVKFYLNGEEFKIDTDLDMDWREYQSNRNYKYARLIVNVIAKKISEEVAIQLIKQNEELLNKELIK